MSINTTEEGKLFAEVELEIHETLTLPHDTKVDLQIKLTRLNTALNNLDRLYLTASRSTSLLSVQRAVLIGRVCIAVKDQLLHGEWTTWAADHFTEDIRTLQSYSKIARSGLINLYGHIGLERFTLVVRLEHLLSPGTDVASLLSSCGLDPDLEAYTVRELRDAVTVIMNKHHLSERGILLSNEDVKLLSGNFNLIKNNAGVLSRLQIATEEQADFEIVVKNLIANGGSKRPPKKVVGKERKEDLSHIVEDFIRGLTSAMDNSHPTGGLDRGRLTMAARVLSDYLDWLDGTLD